jgi:RNA polymerase sigma factor (TIGR02999 family)
LLLQPFTLPVNVYRMSDVTQILEAMAHGDPKAADQLLPLVYDELRRLAAQRLAREAPGQTLQPTALVHEAYLRLVASGDTSVTREQQWGNRGHFFAAAAEAMRRILIDAARRKNSLREGGDRKRQPLEGVDIAAVEPSADILAIDDAVERFEKIDPLKAKLVKLRYFAGLTIPEAAEALGISPATADRYWSFARAWLHVQLKKGWASDRD